MRGQAQSMFCQHKLGADRVETFLAVRVDSDNRLKDLGPVTEIDVHPMMCHLCPSSHISS